MHRHVHALALILLVFIAFGSIQLLFFEGALNPFGFAVNNVSNASSGAQGTICIGARPPEIVSIPDQSAAANQLFTYTVNATQTNGHALTFADDTSLFTIGSSTGLISFTPTDAQEGGYTIAITVTDPLGCSASNDTDTFLLNITGNVTVPPTTPPIPNNRPAPPPLAPPSIRPPPPQRVEVFSPYYVIDIRQIVINGEVAYDQYRNIRATESVVAANSLVTIQVTVRNVGFNPLTGITLNIPLSGGAELLGINPPMLAQLDPNQEFTFTAQIQMGEQPIDLAITAQADQDADVEITPLVMEPTFENPQFGFAVPPWLPLFIAIPLLFFLGYSLTRNKELVRDFLQNLLTGLFAFFLRRTYFLDEDMLRKLIKAKKVNKFMRLHAVPDVYARYHDQIKNLRTRELKKADYDNIAILIRQYVIGGEMAALIVMTVDKPHPRILTTFKPSEKLAKDYKRITFRDPVNERAKASSTERRSPPVTSEHNETKLQSSAQEEEHHDGGKHQ